MPDIYQSHIWVRHHRDMNGALAQVIADARAAFAALHRIHWRAPWDDGPQR